MTVPVDLFVVIVVSLPLAGAWAGAEWVRRRERHRRGGMLPIGGRR